VQPGCDAGGLVGVHERVRISVALDGDVVRATLPVRA
jgi:hypothetical protein